MDAINKFINIQKSVLFEPSESTAEQSPQQVSSMGIARTADSFENLQQPPVEFSNLTDPMMEITATTPAETVEASSMFDALTADELVAPGDALGKKLAPPPYAETGPGDVLTANHYQPLYKEIGPAKIEAIKTPESEAITKMISNFKTYFQKLASDEKGFHDLMRKVFGWQSNGWPDEFIKYGLPEPYSVDKAEEIRQRALAGDFRWLPQVEFVSRRELSGKNGIFEEGPPAKMLLSDQLLNDPELAADSFIKGVGFHLDNLTNDPEVFEQGKQIAQEVIEEARRQDAEGRAKDPYWNYKHEGGLEGQRRKMAKAYESSMEALGNEGEKFRWVLTGQQPLTPPANPFDPFEDGTYDSKNWEYF